MHRTSRGYRYASPDGDKTILAGAFTIYRYASSNEDFFRQEYQQILSNVSEIVPLEDQPVRAEGLGRNEEVGAFFSQAVRSAGNSNPSNRTGAMYANHRVRIVLR